MAASYTKKVKFDDGSTSVTLGGIQIKRQWKNKLDGYAEPDQSGGNPKRLSLNLNQVKEDFEITATIDDDLASTLNSSSDDKETIEDSVLTIAESGNLVTFTYGSETYDGYIQQMTITEESGQDGAKYQFKIRFLQTKSML